MQPRSRLASLNGGAGALWLIVAGARVAQAACGYRADALLAEP